MIPPSSAFLVCALQVTIIAAATLIAGSLTRFWHLKNGSFIPLAGLALVTLVTALAPLPWPVWLDSTWPPATSLITPSPSTLASETMLSARESEPGATFDLRQLLATARSQVREQFLRVKSQEQPTGFSWFLFFWTSATTYSLVRLAVRWMATRRLVRRSVPIADPALSHLCHELSQRLGVRRPVELRETADLRDAATWGVRSSVILLPGDWRASPLCPNTFSAGTTHQ